MTIALVLGLALILDAIIGEPRLLWDRLPHPAVLMGRAVTALDQALNRGQARRFKGVVAVLVLAFVALGIGWMLGLAGPVVQVLCGAILLAQRSLVQHVGAVSAALRLSVSGGRQMVARIVSRNTDDMSTPDIARAAIESAAENLSDGVVAPAFWFLVGGLPGLLLYKMINTADSMIGYRNERYGAFGWAAARADDALNLIPARLTALMIAALGGELGAWRAITHDARRHRSPNAGWPEAAMARSLDIALAGPRTYDGHVQDLAWVNGDAERQIGPNDIDAAVSVLWRVWAMLLALTLAIALGSALTLG